MKEKYEAVELEVIRFRTEDVIATSSTGDDDESRYETSRIL